jgi:dienelactone hydrolase
LQKPQIHSGLRSISIRVVSFASILVLSIVLSSFNTIRVSTVTFIAADGLVITADEYIIESDNPYILLFHQQGSSRGEFKDIARRLCKMDYNCLAVDLRNGGNDNFVSNQTVKQLREDHLEADINDIDQDVVAAIQYAQEKSNLPVVLFGSGANGSLSLKIALTNDHVRAVVALSPGEYFLPEISIKDTIVNLKKPVFITSSKAELPYVLELASGMEKDSVTIFEPKQGEGARGTASFSSDYKQNSEYWFALIFFFKDLI